MRSQLLRWPRAAVFGCLLSFGAVPFAAHAQASVNPNPVEAPEVKSLSFRGVENVDAFDLERSIASIATTCRNAIYTPFCKIFGGSSRFVRKQFLDRDEVARDIIRIRVYYWMRGYRATEVDTIITKTGDNEVSLTFDVREHQPTIVRRVQVEYDSLLLRGNRIRKMTLLKAGQPLDLVKLDSMRLMFANEMSSEGHSDATVDTTVTIDAGSRLADVHFRLIPNHSTYIGDIVINGLEKVERQTVLNSITLRTGELFRAHDVLESQRNLFESGLFRLAAVEVPPQFDSVKRVTITVAESPLQEYRVGAGLTNIEFIQTDARYSALNLLGGARRLDISATVGNILAQQLKGNGFFYDPNDVIPGSGVGKYLQPTWAASIDFRQPAFLRRPRTSAGFGGFAHRRSTPGIFIDRGFGGSATITHHVRMRAPLSATYRYEVNRVDAGDVYFCINYGVCEMETIDVLRAHQRLSPVSLDGFIDRSDDPLDPTRGYQARGSLEHASLITMSDYGYTRAYLDVAAYNHIGPTKTYGGHLRAGFIRTGIGRDDVLHPRKLFYAGGANSVRGFATNQLGPRVLTVAPDRLILSGCDLAALDSCNPNRREGDTLSLSDKDFKPQALGGTSILEASIEARMAIGVRRQLWAAAFIDGAAVGSGVVSGFTSLRDVVKGSVAITPGFGIRYKSPVGPIRVDLGFNSTKPQELPVVTEGIVNGERRVTRIPTARLYQAKVRWIDRFTLHFSIGQPW